MSESLIPRNYFDRSKLFYPLVMNYLVQLIGWKEISLRAIARPETLAEKINRIPVLAKSIPGSEGAQKKIVESLKKLMGPLELKSVVDPRPIEIEVDFISRELLANHNYLTSYLMRSAGSLLILADEITWHAPWNDHGPMLEFLHHCRNAAAHSGKFHFIGKQPDRPASWKNLTIVRTLQDTPLFIDSGSKGMLYPGDPITLLWDIEQSYPQLSV